MPATTLDEIFARLTRSAKHAVQDAEGIRVAVDGDAVHVEHLLLALYDRKGGPVQRVFERAGMRREDLTDLLESAAKGRMPPAYDRVALQVMPRLSPHAEQAVLAAVDFASGDTVRDVSVNDLFEGMLTVGECHVVQAIGRMDLSPFGQRRAGATGERKATGPEQKAAPPEHEAGPKQAADGAEQTAASGGGGQDDIARQGEQATEGPARTVLGKGAHGDDVRDLQATLAALGLFQHNQDGVYGPDTEQAVRAFQDAQGIAADGVAGPETRSALEAAVAEGGGAASPDQDVRQESAQAGDATGSRPNADGVVVELPHGGPGLRSTDLEPHVRQALAHALAPGAPPDAPLLGEALRTRLGAAAVLDGVLRTTTTSKAFGKVRELLEALDEEVPDPEPDVTVPPTFLISEGLAEAIRLAGLAVEDRETLWGRTLVTALVYGPEWIFAESRDLDRLGTLREGWAGFLREVDPQYADRWDAVVEMMTVMGPPAEEEHETDAPPRLGAGIASVDPDRVRPDATDHLGVENEAFAFARVAASHSIEPPLSVGVFGEWGSGKTFFMEKMRAHVGVLQESARAARDAKKDTAYHGDIVQIQFNAWHYMETNLWASLVDHIFRELDKWLQRADTEEERVEALYERLSTARLLKLEALEDLVAARRRRKAAEKQAADARSALAQAESDRDSARVVDYWKAVRDALGDESKVPKEERDALQRAATSLGFVQLSDSAKGLVEAVDQARDQSQQGRLLARSVVSRLASPLWMVPLLVLVVALPVLAPPLVRALLAELRLGSLADGLSATAIAISTAVATVTGWLGTAVAMGKGAVGRLAAFQATLDQAIAERREGKPDALGEHEEAVARHQKEVELAEANLERTDKDLKEARTGFEETAAVRLHRFIRDKIVNGDYAKHLGIIASVRKDFEDLAHIMTDATAESQARIDFERERQAHAARVEELRKRVEEDLLTEDELADLEGGGDGADEDLKLFQRIILYIDDLDRCPPKTVVDVLQACHLLLSFPLFVVVVAVDARWVSRALLEQYKGLLASDPDANGVERNDHPVVEGSASPRDYLEKIFQIPYWVRHMHPSASRTYTEDLVGPVVEDFEDDDGTHAGGAHLGAPSGAGVDDDGPSSPEDPLLEEQDELPVEPPVQPTGRDDTADAPAPRHDAPVEVGDAPPVEPPDPNPVSLRLTSHERDLLSRLAPFAGDSPRSIKRFVNVYRLLRTGLGDDDLRTLVGKEGESLVYVAIIAQLAIVTGAPTLADEYFDVLGPEDRRDSATPNSLTQLLDKMPSANGSTEWKRSPEWPRLKGALGILKEIENSRTMTAEMRRRAGIVKRYSFSARPYL